MAGIFDTPTIKKGGSIFDPVKKEPIDILKEAGYEPKQSGWSLLGKGFVNVLGGVLNVLRTGEYAVGGILAGKSPITGIKEKISPSEVLFEDREEDRKLWSQKGVTALAVDILLDPVTYLTFGAGKAIKLTTKGGQLLINKSGQKLIKQIISKGASEAAARRTMARVIQEGGEAAARKYIGKSGLKFMGRTFIPMEAFQKAGQALQKVPGAGVFNRVGSGFARAFKPFSEIDGLPAKIGGKGTYSDHLFRPFTRETQAKIFNQIDEVKKIAAKAYKEHGIDVGKTIGQKIETRQLTGSQFLDDVIKWIGKEQDEMLKIEKATGKKIGEIKGYLRHYLTPDGRKFIEKGDDFMGMLPKPLRAKLKAAEPRKLVRVVSEAGKDVTWDKAKYTLKPFKEAKVIDQLENIASKKIKALQNLQTALAKGDIDNIMNLWREHKVALGKHISKFPEVQKTVTEIAEFSQKEFGNIVSGLASFEARKLAPIIKDLEDLVKTSQGREFLYKPLEAIKKIPYQKKVIDAQKKILSIQKELGEQIKKYQFFDYIDAKGNFYKAVRAGEEYKDALPLTIKEINDYMKAKHGVKNFFEPDAFKAFAIRKAEHIKYINTHKFLEATKARFGTRLDKVKETVVDGVRLVESTNPQLKGWLMPEPIVKHLDETLKVLTNEESMKGFVGLYDKALGIWKKNVTGMWPSFHTRNFIGGFFNNWLAGVRAIDNIDAWKILNGSDDIIKTEIGTKYSGKQVLDLAERFWVRGQPGMMDVYRSVNQAVEEVTARNIKKIGIKASNAPRFAMEFVEDRLRLPLFINRLKKGYSPAEAAKDVFKFHFDYLPETGLTAFERLYMRRLVPFYVWTRNNVPLQIEQMMKQPGKYANLEKVRQSMFGEKEFKELASLPDWMQEMFIAPLPWKDDAGRTLWAQLDLPLEDINKLPINSSGIREIASMLTPFLKFPMERYFNKNMYFGGDIYNPDLPKELQTRKATDALKHLPSPIKKFLNFREVKYRDWKYKDEKRFITRYEMDAKKLHIISTFLGRYYSTLSGTYDEDVPAEWKASRYVGGIPIRTFDIPEEQARKESEQERQVQEIMNWLKRHKVIPYEGEKTNIFD
ncbi:MAG: hypothetical protein PHV11_06265 [Candidatus Bipolaricaulis sp.]|nr:hypothetical protein [Candidatus Bipolaricaulis sp.]